MTVAPQADQEVVQGIVQGIVQKAADKWQIEVNVGQQNPRRLWTKDPEIVNQMATMIGQTISFMCGVSHWTNNQNQAIRSLWINGYGAPGTQALAPQPQSMNAWQPPMQQPVTQMAAPQQQPVMQQPVLPPVQQDTVEQKIHRQTATKVAAQLLKHLKPEDQTFDTLIKMSERLVAYYDHGVSWGGDNLPGNPVDGAPPHSDDDIPF